MTTKRLFAGAGAVILLIFVIATINWIGVQQNRMMLLQADIFNLKNELNDTIEGKLDEVKQQIFEELNRQNSNVFDESYAITGYDKAENLAYVTVSFALKEYSPSESVTVVCSGAGGSQTAPAKNSKGLFQAELALKIDSKTQLYNYSLSYRTSTDRISGGEIMELCPATDLYGRMGSKGISVDEMGYNQKTKKETIQVHAGFQNYFGSDEKLKFVSCKLQITFDGNVIETVDLMGKIRVQDGCQLFYREEPFQFSYDFNKLYNKSEQFPQILYDSYISATDGYGFEYRL